MSSVTSICPAARADSGGDLFISDRTPVDVSNYGTVINNKTELDIATYSTYPNTDTNYAVNRYRIKLGVNTGSKLWNDIRSNGGDSFCSGNIYYYYYEDNSRVSPLSTISTYYGCIELEAVRQYILEISDPADYRYASASAAIIVRTLISTCAKTSRISMTIA